ncbi:hypothetical protein ACTOTM_18970 [Bacillus subtilis]|uniref:Uncharacterized protein n=1 Tax=Bacillus subtilis TaxID=1423 RepID=A0AC61Z7D8_BACIU|nr:hypothetical protein [Bacillus subtilis]OTQ84204.1 hypothetical protein BG30_15400 [Bacillus subtilis subsp. subtilis]MCM3191303.1 hypothetical protein [Bacillus subtilis]MED3604162.1 hypothetical protein [Bacillus subtilis]MED3692560.1 hypothetical protein [Bacillus subtilis]WGE08083.1 hypothetical protein P5658_05330 [Bacillus subtilis]
MKKVIISLTALTLAIITVFSVSTFASQQKNNELASRAVFADNSNVNKDTSNTISVASRAVFD